jgi:hypothetical protein
LIVAYSRKGTSDIYLWSDGHQYICTGCPLLGGNPANAFTTRSPDGALAHIRRHESNDHQVSEHARERIQDEIQEHGMQETFHTIFGHLRSDFECGEGWYDILYDFGQQAHDLISDQAPDFDRPESPVIVKEKFGGLRIQMFTSDFPDTVPQDKIQALCRDAERESFETCEICGRDGEHRETQWGRTLCDHHHNQKMD